MYPTDSSEIECPHCGETFYYELTRCPNCGRNLYPSEFEEPNDNEEADAWGVSPHDLEASHGDSDRSPHPLTGILVGGFVSCLIGVVLFFIFDRLFTNPSDESPTRFLVLASVPIGSVAGGYIAGRYNETRPTLSGVGVGLLSLGGAILLAAYQYDLAVEPLIRPETLPWWAITILAGWGGAVLSQRHTQHQTVHQLFKPRTEYALYTELLTKVQFDRETAESLIAYEQKRTPDGMRITWIQNAIDRWERDNRVSG